MNASPLCWTYRILWLSLAVTLGDYLGDVLSTSSSSVQWAFLILSWLLWAVNLAATMFLVPASLVVLRLLTPVTLVVGAALLTKDLPDALGWIGLITTVALTAIVLLPQFGEEFINGASYGDERRFPLRPPALILVGVIPVLWILAVLFPVAGILLLAANQWVGGVATLLIGFVALWFAVPAMNRLTRRWAVLVPAGVTLVDEFALAEPMLFRSAAIRALGPADTEAELYDLTAQASGLAIGLELKSVTPIVPRPQGDEVASGVEVTGVMFCPTRPGAFVAAAKKRRIAVQ